MALKLALEVFLALSPQAGPYDADPRHPWNELHRALFTWHSTRGDALGGLEPDPLFWPPGADPWTLSGNLSTVLDGFIRDRSESLLKDPLKRALLQRDLWMFLDGLEGLPMANTRTWPLEGEDARTELRRRLVPLLRRLALAPDEIRALPDNYAAAVKSKAHAAWFDAADPERPFLPPDLREPEGPWVLVGREDDSVLAKEHVKLVRGRSVFLVFAALPDGRAATLKYLQGPRSLPHGSLPAPPAGTRFVLLRRAFLLDPKGDLHLSPLTEQVMIRATLATSRPEPAGFFEFHLNRGDLFSGVAGGLRAAGPEDQGVVVFFNRIATAKATVRKTCIECHRSSPTIGLGIAGRDPETRESRPDGVVLRASTVEREAELTMKRQRADPSWKRLSGFWPKE